MAAAELVYTYSLLFLEPIVQAQFVPITTIPNLPDDILATNYAGLQLSTRIPVITPMYTACLWVVFQNGAEILEEYFYSSFVALPCANRSVNEAQWDITCTNADGVISTSLNIYTPVTAGMWSMEVNCFIGNPDETPDERLSISINVRGLLDLILTNITDCL